MKIGLVQYSPEWENKEKNIEKLNGLIETQCSDEEILIFPEMTLTGFTMKSREKAEEIDGTGMQYFMKKAVDLKKHILAGIIEKDENKIYNTLFHFDTYGIITARYRKIHPFSYADEDQYYNTGKEPLVTKVGKFTFGLSICYDLRFPELYRFYGKEKVHAIINIANWPVPRIHHWKTLLKARAIENQCFMIGVNRVGEAPFNKYNGCSAVYDPMGEKIVLNENEEKIITVEIDLDKSKNIQERFRFLNDIKLI
ncbi:MAG: nitrilase-related carbon-nitrogen hydrolase [Ignavibacteria bacterium]|jgi:predicted amidohydrolase